MFENCTTIKELNKRRAELAGSADVLRLNKEYAAAKRRILAANPVSVKVPVFGAEEPPPPVMGFCPIAGKSGSPGKIVITAEGAYFG
jgi:hypothetical protein